MWQILFLLSGMKPGDKMDFLVAEELDLGKGAYLWVEQIGIMIIHQRAHVLNVRRKEYERIIVF